MGTGPQSQVLNSSLHVNSHLPIALDNQPMYIAAYYDLVEGAHLHDILKLLIHVTQGELACSQNKNNVSGQTAAMYTEPTMFQFINQLLILIQLQITHFLH